jgi:predicted nucleic acid-binding protein
MDALHLASALELGDGELPVAFATFDRDLAAAARTEGLEIPFALG